MSEDEAVIGSDSSATFLCEPTELEVAKARPQSQRRADGKFSNPQEEQTLDPKTPGFSRIRA